MQSKSIWDLVEQYANEPLALLAAVGGYYETVKDKATGKRLTPLVGYAGKYDAGNGTELQFVGDIYANFAKAEENPLVMFHYTKMLWEKIKLTGPVVFVGPQMGGVAVAQFLALHASLGSHTARYACAEKIITQVKKQNLREQSELQFARHAINEGDKVVIVEDVLNNFSTTKQLIELVSKHGATVSSIVGLLNRSMTVEDQYEYVEHPMEYTIPVVALVRKPYPEYKQTDPEVVNEIANKNVVWKPKNEWHMLEKAISLANCAAG